MKQKIQDKYRYCSTCQKVLLDHVVEGYEYDYWLKDPISGNRFGSTLFGYNEFIITGNSNPPIISNNNNKEINSNIKFDKKFIHINSNTNNE
ncbi:unnamed protein product [Rotaria sordida]|uniref:Uncharacterized protein n=1 Tax=Rotaria sordida TaxID=392033 RepID=A0A814YIQ3_9BILA|nr:unnamed protein product [Rotaria sordida]